jgi:hypothetical protein
MTTFVLLVSLNAITQPAFPAGDVAVRQASRLKGGLLALQIRPGMSLPRTRDVLGTPDLTSVGAAGIDCYYFDLGIFIHLSTPPLIRAPLDRVGLAVSSLASQWLRLVAVPLLSATSSESPVVVIRIAWCGIPLYRNRR